MDDRAGIADLPRTGILTPITARFEFDEAEYRRALHESSRPSMRRAMLAVAVLFPAAGLWLGVVRQSHELSLGDAFVNGLPWLLLGALLLGLVPLVERHRARHALEDDPSLNGPQVRTVDDAGLQVRGAGYAPSLRWEDLDRIVESRHFFLFYEDERVMHYLPKRVLSPQERDSLRNVIQARAARC